MKTKLTLLLFSFLLIAGCGPSEGDVYENRLTRERVKIEAVGIGRELAEEIETHNQDVREYIREEDFSLELMLTLLKEPLLSPSDGSKRCVMYYASDAKYTDVAQYQIEPVDSFEKEWVKVN